MTPYIHTTVRPTRNRNKQQHQHQHKTQHEGKGGSGSNGSTSGKDTIGPNQIQPREYDAISASEGK